MAYAMEPYFVCLHFPNLLIGYFPLAVDIRGLDLLTVVRGVWYVHNWVSLGELLPTCSIPVTMGALEGGQDVPCQFSKMLI